MRALGAFELERLEYVLISATAMGIHGLVRATEDVDLFIRATAENIDRLRRALRSVYPGDSHMRNPCARRDARRSLPAEEGHGASPGSA